MTTTQNATSEALLAVIRESDCDTVNLEADIAKLDTNPDFSGLPSSLLAAIKEQMRIGAAQRAEAAREAEAELVRRRTVGAPTHRLPYVR